MEKGGQQEIAGFVIIVVLVVVATLIFMVISFRNKEASNNSLEVSSLLDSLLGQTTECVFREPLPADLEEVFEEAYGGTMSCKDMDISTKEYLSKKVYESMDNVLRIDNRFEAWQLDVLSGEEELRVDRFYKGQCGDKTAIGAERLIGEDYKVWLGVCLN